MWSWLAIALSSLLSIFASVNNNRSWSIVFGSFTHILLMVLVVGQMGSWSAKIYWLVAGLGLFLIVDAAGYMKLSHKMCFLGYIVAQVFYSKFFWLQIQSDVVLWLPALLVGIAVVTFFLLLPRLDSLVLPVTVMGCALLLLVCSAGEVWLTTHSQSDFLGFLGALIMAVSALLFAVEKYKRPRSGARYLISGSYFLSHALIVASVL
ncbi:lysoplasmalogenase [Vibrio sp. ZSDZ34]|jgi:uncharacterized membrane protein YhhN|uniref:Lysoplasmalogenase n=1 Tax=Vibrio gelatinilyticus TaxID=2893468 RepID=A0A9X2AX69_9VIBR|nr:lysoplasmalogenase [Vibrio gelatinilyticus]MCJ2378729.1 lysoplasmalogenase [Vibrio gelatinilyticus]